MAVIIVDPDNIIEGDDVTTNTTLRTQTLNPGTGTNIPAAADGIALQALYSWDKEEWKDVLNRSRYPFPFDAITPEQMEMRKGWEHGDVASEKAVRTGGWRYIDTDNGNKIVKEFFGAVSLGTFEDITTDTAYYVLGNDPTDIAAAVSFDFPGPVNEIVVTYENLGNPDTCDFATSSTITRATGSFVTDGYAAGGQVTVLNSTSNDGTYVITAVAALTLTVTGTPFATGADVAAELAVNNRNAIALFLRVRDGDTNGKTFAKSALSDIGVTEVDNKVFRFPLTNATDLDILATDGAIAGTPWSDITIQYFATAFSIDIDGVTNRDFGIVVNVGTFAGVDGSSAGTSVLTSALGDIPVSTAYDGGTLFITSGPDDGSSYPIVSTTATTVTITGSLTTNSNQSFYLQKAVPVVATKKQIYEKVQFSLRQAANINTAGSGGIITGKTADAIASFVGPDLKFGLGVPSNAEGGGSGVTVLGFDANDTNNLFFTDNLGNSYSYPFVAAGNMLFNQNAVDDAGPAEYVMYFEYTERFTDTTFGLSASAGQVATLDSSVTDLTAELTSGDFIKMAGFTDPNNDGLYEVTGAPAGAGPWTAEVTKRFNTDAISDEAAGASVSIDKNPIDSDDAIVVNDNSGTPITGTITGLSQAWDFDYDNNVQGVRTAPSPAAVIVRVLGTNKAVNSEGSSTITRATGQSISVTAPLERNYVNPV
jgi:hypothetical protein